MFTVCIYWWYEINYCANVIRWNHKFMRTKICHDSRFIDDHICVMFQQHESEINQWFKNNCILFKPPRRYGISIGNKLHDLAENWMYKILLESKECISRWYSKDRQSINSTKIYSIPIFFLNFFLKHA